MDVRAAENNGRLALRESEGDRQVYAAVGDWVVTYADSVEGHCEKTRTPEAKEAVIDIDEVGSLDTSGAWLLLRVKYQWERAGHTVELRNMRSEHVTLMAAIAKAFSEVYKVEVVEDTPPTLWQRFSSHVDAGVEDAKRLLSLLGAVTIVLGRRLTNPSTIRLPALVTHMMRTGLTAVPIIALMSFVIGAIVAQQGAYQLSFYGADAMSADFVGVLVTRNLGVLLTAIMIAGRSGSAYTAEIGSMRMREEIDALKVIGLDPVDVLLFPRIAALILILPLLTVISNYAALAGAYLSLWIYIDLSWTVFVERIRDAVPLSYFLMGVIKAPFMALIIGLIAMSEGLKVAGSSESLSKHTTIAVVKSIFMVIVVDGIFAVISANLGY